MINRLIITTTLAVSVLSSCQYLPTRQLDKSITRETEEYFAELSKQEAEQKNANQERYNWDQALEQMYTKNTNCRRATFRLEDAKSNERNYWRRFIPSLTASINDRVTLDGLADTFVNPTFRVNSFLSLGNLLSMPKDIYTRKLNTVAAELSEQLAMRQQTIDLYRLFEERRLWEIEGEALNLSKHLIETTEKVDPDAALSRKQQYEQRLLAWKEREERWLEIIGGFYNVRPGKITLIADTAPKIKYSSDKLNFHDTNRWGKLQLKLVALQEVGNDQDLRELYLRYLPRPTLSASAPSIFSNTSNNDFDVGEVALNPGASWRLDTTGTIGQQIKRLKRERPIDEWEKEKRVQSEVQTLLKGRKRLQEAEKEIKAIRSAKKDYIMLVQDNLLDQEIDTILTNLQRLTTQEIALNSEIISISSGYWLIDEAWWTKHQRPWKDIN